MAVLSDEHTATELGAGGAEHCPDAVYDSASGRLLLRAERSGRSDGRVSFLVPPLTSP